MTLFDFFQLIGGIILGIGYIPQIKQLVHTKSCEDLNLKTYMYLSLGIILMEIYAVNLTMHGNGCMFLITNTLSLLLVLFITVMIIRIRLMESRPGMMNNHAFFVSKWDDGSVVVTPCKINMSTNEIVDIATCPCDINSNPETESVLLCGEEYDVKTIEEPYYKKFIDRNDDWLPF